MTVYYIEYKDSDSIELMNSMTEYGVIDMAKNYDTNITDLTEAIKTLMANGYQVFEEC